MYINVSRVVQCLVVMLCCLSVKSTTFFNSPMISPFAKPFPSPFSQDLSVAPSIGIRRAINPAYNSLNALNSDSLFKRRCPLCDSSVYSYCSEKLFHDSCCCHNPNNPYDELPYQCQLADCSFLHANSCREHKMISACCCTNFLIYRK